jgi:DNA-binding IclR family transcriptional regulator
MSTGNGNLKQATDGRRGDVGVRKTEGERTTVRAAQRTSATPAGPRAPTVIAVRHALDILRGFSAEAPQQGVSEIARRMGLHKSSVSRLVATLEQDHLLERDRETNRIRLGVGLISLAAPLLVNVKVAAAARPYLAELAQRSGETINFSIWDGAGAVSLEQALGGNAIAHYAPPGSRNPAHCTASGKLLLAYAPPGEIERTLARPLERFTPRTVCDAAKLRAEIATIRSRGYALNAGEFAPDVGAVAAVVRNVEGEVVGAITATVPTYRFEAARRAELTELVRDTAAGLSKRLGYVGAGRAER